MLGVKTQLRVVWRKNGDDFSFLGIGQNVFGPRIFITVKHIDDGEANVVDRLPLLFFVVEI